MCGRFVITTAGFNRIEATLGTTFPEVRPRYNISPSQIIPVIRESAEGAHELVEMRWGLVPHWSKEPKTPYSTFNARAETLAEKPAFRGPFRWRRFLIPTSGFYEWKTEAGRKQPCYLTGEDDGGLAFARPLGRMARFGGEPSVLHDCGRPPQRARRSDPR